MQRVSHLIAEVEDLEVAPELRGLKALVLRTLLELVFQVELVKLERGPI
jgi:hypothetical protein